MSKFVGYLWASAGSKLGSPAISGLALVGGDNADGHGFSRVVRGPGRLPAANRDRALVVFRLLRLAEDTTSAGALETAGHE